MILLPAIDIKSGKCIRLTLGDFATEKIYYEDPNAVAQKFQKDGAQMLHIVDLDGAKDGVMKNKDLIKKIAHTIPIEVGGGIRDEETISDLLSAGVNRVILGTKALEDSEFLQKMITLFQEKIVVGLDAKNGKLLSHGWLKESSFDVFSFAKQLEKMGAKTIIYTDILKDGTLTSPNFESLKILRKNLSLKIIASGGVSRVEDLQQLKQLKIDGVIIGKALYEGKITIKEALHAC